MEIMHRRSSENPRAGDIKDELVLTEFMASIKTTEAELLTNAYFHHYSDKESMKRMGMESVEEIRNSKLNGLKKLMALLNASPQLRAKLKQVI
jgi:spore coat protein CotF